MNIEPDTVWSRLDALDPTDGADRYTWFNILADATFDPLREDPRFDELNAKFGVIGLPDG